MKEDTISTVNYDTGNGMLININQYIICIKDNDAYMTATFQRKTKRYQDLATNILVNG